MSIPDGIEFVTPRRILEDSHEIEDRAGRLSERLQSEIPEEHALHGLKVRAIATGIDRDDVLFEIEGGEMYLAVVHMTWRKEVDPSWPDTKLFQGWDDWVRNEMLPAHEEYEPT